MVLALQFSVSLVMLSLIKILTKEFGISAKKKSKIKDIYNYIISCISKLLLISFRFHCFFKQMYPIFIILSYKCAFWFAHVWLKWNKMYSAVRREKLTVLPVKIFVILWTLSKWMYKKNISGIIIHKLTVQMSRYVRWPFGSLTNLCVN